MISDTNQESSFTVTNVGALESQYGKQCMISHQGIIILMSKGPSVWTQDVCIYMYNYNVKKLKRVQTI